MIIHSSSVSPVPTHQYLQRTLQYVLYLYCFMLVMQLPLILLEVPVNLTKVTVWLLYLLALSALLKRRNNLAQPRIKSGLFLLYFSYLVIAIKLWPAVTNTHYFLLLSLVIAGFVFTRQERNIQHTMVAIALLLYVFISTFLYVNNELYTLIQFCNDITLGVICLVIYRVFQHVTLLRWQHLRSAHTNSVNTLSRFVPNEPDKPDLLWPLGVTRKFDCVTVLFADLAGYTQINRCEGDDKTLAMMKALFRRIDQRLARYGLEKIKTNGDQYIAIGPLQGKDHLNCQVVMDFALELHQLISRLSRRSPIPFQLRIGIATGPLSAGMIGSQRPQFDVWGQTVNLAAYLEQTCTSAAIRCCANTAALLNLDTTSSYHALRSHKHPQTKGCYEFSPSAH